MSTGSCACDALVSGKERADVSVSAQDARAAFALEREGITAEERVQLAEVALKLRLALFPEVGELNDNFDCVFCCSRVWRSYPVSHTRPCVRACVCYEYVSCENALM